MCIKLDGKYIWILYQKDYFSKLSIFYALESNKTSKIANYIGLSVHYLRIPEILQFDNGWELKGVLLIFPKNHNIKLIN